MRLSQYFVPTLRQAPSDADTVSAKLMQRAGMVRKVASGIYEWLPLGLRALKNVERIVREEMNAIGGQEVWLPVVQPKELWEETGRWGQYGKELLRFKDRKESEFCLAPTAEEVITDLIRKEVKSYRQLPVFLYQFGTKFRDEIRPRFGVMRAREFYMKDGYSFHADEKDAEKFYRQVYDAYSNIFKRCGLKFQAVEAETGPIGGSFSHEFMVLAETGENEIATCSCGYAANSERAECAPSPSSEPEEPPHPLQEVPTPNAWTVEDVAKLLKAPKEKFIKTLFYNADQKPVVILIRGDHELNENKLIRFLNCKKLEKATDKEYEKIAGCPVGFAGPVGLNHIPLIADHAIRTVSNGISGANKKDTHLKNINVTRDYHPGNFADLHLATRGDLCTRCGKPFSFCRGIEVGHTFKLGAKYSESMKGLFLDAQQKSKPYIMGCYGIGVSRVVAAAIEQGHDENGILWPAAIAPYKIHLISIENDIPAVKQESNKLYQDFQKADIPILWDDRDERAGVKFKDADLIGAPIRITLSSKTLENKSAEIKSREEETATQISLSNVVNSIDKLLHEMIE
ncbi:MAG: proline--tRNA ligase [Elusimicrobia bacterium]|nr:proline--tRNA ligase [Elusimicrobiota bacterium]